MKKYSLVTICLLLLGTALLGSCKRGDEDPFITFRSREARLKGDWKLKEYNRTRTFKGTDIYGEDSLITETYIYDGTNITFNNSITLSTYPFARSISIKDDGRYTMTTVKAGSNETSSGIWYWLDSDKKKSHIYFSDFEEVYLRMLRNDEMKWRIEYATGSESELVEMTWEVE